MANTVAAPQNIEMFIGSARMITVTMSPVVDTSSWTVTFYLRRSSDATDYLVTKNCTGATGGTLTCTIDSTDTINLAEETYSYEFQRTDSGAEDVLAYGSCDLVYPRA